MPDKGFSQREIDHSQLPVIDSTSSTAAPMRAIVVESESVMLNGHSHDRGSAAQSGRLDCATATDDTNKVARTV
jgi:hypothetical protein